MFEIELVCVTDPSATRTDEGMYRYTERVADTHIARLTADTLVHKMTNATTQLNTNVVMAFGGVPRRTVYTNAQGRIVGFLNIDVVDAIDG